MKWLQHPIRVCAIVTVLCAALLTMSLVSHPAKKAYACGRSIVSASTTEVQYIPSGSGGTITARIYFSLWSDTCSSQNFASANVVSGSLPGPYTVTVARLSGPDGGGLSASNYNCPGRGVCDSPGVYSPNNLAYAQIVIPNSIVSTQAF